jgi:hypothetical protein
MPSKGLDCLSPQSLALPVSAGNEMTPENLVAPRDATRGDEFAFTLRYSRATIAVDARRHGRMAMRVPDPDNQRGHDASDRWANAVEQSD